MENSCNESLLRDTNNLWHEPSTYYGPFRETITSNSTQSIEMKDNGNDPCRQWDWFCLHYWPRSCITVCVTAWWSGWHDFVVQWVRGWSSGVAKCTCNTFEHSCNDMSLLCDINNLWHEPSTYYGSSKLKTMRMTLADNDIDFVYIIVREVV